MNYLICAAPGVPGRTLDVAEGRRPREGELRCPVLGIHTIPQPALPQDCRTLFPAAVFARAAMTRTAVPPGQMIARPTGVFRTEENGRDRD